MAGKGGGAWKVAYADFVTAMMAFFLVMWLVSQNAKVKDAVAKYFMDPVGFYQVGSNKNPGDSGAIFDYEGQGRVPGKNFQLAGRGRGSHTDRRQGEAETATVEQSLTKDPEAEEYWRTQALRQKDAATESEYVREKTLSVDQAATIQLAKQLETEFAAKVPEDLDPVYRELMTASMSYVDWRGVAQGLVQRAALTRKEESN